MEGEVPIETVIGTCNANPPMNTNPTASSTTPVVNEVGGEGDKIAIEGSKSRKSIVWDHFTKLPLTETKGEHKAKCNHCRTVYSCHPNKHGTNSLNKHLHRSHNWIFTKTGKKGTLHGYMPKISEGDVVLDPTNSVGYNLEDCRRAVAEFVICDEMPFKVVEGRGFRKMINRLEPRFTVPSRVTIARDCYQLFLDEKKKLKTWFMKCSIRVCMTTDCWTSNQNLGYMCLTAHFIDEEWTLQKRILNFCQIENHKGETIGREIEKCLREWGIESVFTITVDNASSNDGALSYLQKKLDARGGLVCGGKYLHMRCCAHILNLVVNEGTKEQQLSIESIRNAVRFVRSSPQRLKKFKECIEAEMIESQSLVCLDVPTRWNSTYIMLEHAEKFEKAFDRLYDQESDFRKWFREEEKGRKRTGPPADFDWQHARIFVQFLKIFYETTLSFSGSLHVTSNKCFHEIASIQSELTSWSQSHSDLLGVMACSMREKFNKYWGNVEKINPLLFIAVVLDPRYKLEYVTWSLEDIYDKELAAGMSILVKDTLDDLYKFYSKGISEHRESEDGGDSSKSVASDERLKGLNSVKGVSVNRVEVWKKQKRARTNFEKSDLERYLAEDTIDDNDNADFNILSWWRANSSKYRILSVIARDVLAVPVSTVASESCFSTSGRVLDVFRSSLSPKMIEALICTQNWLYPTGLNFDEKDFDQFDSTEKIIDNVSANIIGSQGAHDKQQVMSID